MKTITMLKYTNRNGEKIKTVLITDENVPKPFTEVADTWYKFVVSDKEAIKIDTATNKWEMAEAIRRTEPTW